MEIKYYLMNPTSNYTILVVSAVPVNLYKTVAKELLQIEKIAEQVGFVSFDKQGNLFLQMAGDEFCGNATMSTAVYYGIINKLEKGSVKISVYGIDKFLNVDFMKKDDNCFIANIEMPNPIKFENIKFDDEYKFPVIFFNGIAHIIVEYENLNNQYNLRNAIKSNIKKWCLYLNQKALGIMFFDSFEDKLLPLVYVKDIDTLLFENSCASGTTALGYYLSFKQNDNINKSIIQPCGSSLSVSMNDKKQILLKGIVSLMYEKNWII